VYDIGLDSGNYFFAMEYLHGQDLRSILHRAWREGEKMPLRFAVEIATQVAAALHYAHEMKRPDGSVVDIVHRDVSPSNIIVTYDGAVKLLDFGVAKAATRTVKTRTGTLKGKISYMSPEQAKGAPVDRRSDIFSLGIVLWEMVTTSRLFRGENDLATLQLIINVPPKKPSEARPDCPPELERIILKALSQDITLRYQTTDEMLRDLERFQQDADLGPSPTALSVYVSELFAPEITSWNEAKAAGVPLGEHLTHIGDMTEPVLESEFIEAMDLPAMLAREEELAAMDDEEHEHEHDDDDDDEEEHPTVIPGTPLPTKQDPKRFDTPAPAPAKPRATTPPIPTRAPTTPPPRPPVVAARRDLTPKTKSSYAAAGESTDTVTTPQERISQTFTALSDAPTNLHAPTISEMPPPPSNPWSVAHTPTSSEQQRPATHPPQQPSSPSMSMSMRAAKSLSGIRAWASGSFPAHKIDPAVHRMWERRALVIGGILLGIIFVIAVIAAISN
ncbi:MAG: serine/threonine protein kinase, partial [Deltaproteobacteria bacterium]|nr:serine/threonine protein kinase [Deltaproteobacteria bacterium]